MNVSALRWRGAASLLIASFIKPLSNGLEEQAWWGRGEDGGERSTRREEGQWACLVRYGCFPRVGGRRVQTLPSQHPGFNVQVHFSLPKAWGGGASYLLHLRFLPRKLSRLCQKSAYSGDSGTQSRPTSPQDLLPRFWESHNGPQY